MVIIVCVGLLTANSLRVRANNQLPCVWVGVCALSVKFKWKGVGGSLFLYLLRTVAFRAEVPPKTNAPNAAVEIQSYKTFMDYACSDCVIILLALIHFKCVDVRYLIIGWRKKIVFLLSIYGLGFFYSSYSAADSIKIFVVHSNVFTGQNVARSNYFMFFYGRHAACNAEQQQPFDIFLHKNRVTRAARHILRLNTRHCAKTASAEIAMAMKNSRIRVELMKSMKINKRIFLIGEHSFIAWFESYRHVVYAIVDDGFVVYTCAPPFTLSIELLLWNPCEFGWEKN